MGAARRRHDLSDDPMVGVPLHYRVVLLIELGDSSVIGPLSMYLESDGIAEPKGLVPPDTMWGRSTPIAS
jgi:hypothetical protein